MIRSHHHIGQIHRNWGMIVLILSIVFGAGIVWSFTQRSFLEKETFDVHIEAESVRFENQNKLINEKFNSQSALIEEKFKSTDMKIGHISDHLEKIEDILINGPDN